MENCIFCKIANKDFPSSIIYEDDDFIAIFDKFPATYGHTLILPKNHVENIFNLSPEVGGNLFKLAIKISKHLQTQLNINDLNILQNNGELAGQTVNHFHLHLVPRYENDEVIIKSKTDEISNEELKKLQEKLKLN